MSSRARYAEPMVRAMWVATVLALASCSLVNVKSVGSAGVERCSDKGVEPAVDVGFAAGFTVLSILVAIPRERDVSGAGTIGGAIIFVATVPAYTISALVGRSRIRECRAAKQRAQ